MQLPQANCTSVGLFPGVLLKRSLHCGARAMATFGVQAIIIAG